MASISAPTFTSQSTRSDAIPHKLTLLSAKFGARLKQAKKTNNLNHLPLSSSHSLSRTSDSSFCRCRNNNNDEIDPLDSSPEHGRWNSAVIHVVRTVIRKLDSYLSFCRDQLREERDVSKNLEVMERQNRNLDDDDEWDWERWSKHFIDVDEQERIVSVLKSQIALAIASEDYQDAARLKVAVAAAATNDTVGLVMSHLNKAIAEERYHEAVFLRDKAGAGLVGWWSAISEDNNGHIFRISAEHGRYVARSFSPRQLATAMTGLPVFEIFLTTNKKGEYKQQAVYLSPAEIPQDVPVSSRGPTRISNPLDSSDISNLFASPDDIGDSEDQDNDSDIADGLSDFEPLLRDMIPGAKVKVLKVTASGKFDPDLISKVVDQIIEDEDEEDAELEIMDTEDEDEDKDKDESNQERNHIEMDADDGIVDDEEQNEISVKVVIGDALHKVQSSSMLKKTMTRIPAKLERKGRMAFSFSIEKNDKQQISSETEKSIKRKRPKLQGQHSVDQIMSDLAKSIGRGKIPMKVLRDVGKLIDLTLNQVQNHLVLSDLTTFNRIEVPTSSDPLNGLYIGSHGLYASEVIHLRHKFGQWHDVGSSEPENLQFYEYVEAVKLTGDPYVPAGQVAFRAKIGKAYQLPHKGIIPEEFGVIARYRGQGRLAEPGFKNPRWVDGELVILDGKYIKGGPVVGFVYWVPAYNFLVFFNRLKLQD